jgi:hypothetical protein
MLAPPSNRALTCLFRPVPIAKLSAQQPAADHLPGGGHERWGGTRLPTAVIAVAFLATVLIAGWSAPRGFDFLDSGVYYLEYKYPDDVADTHTTYRLFARPFYLLVGESIIGFRWVSWLLLWAAAGFFGWAWWRFHRALEPDAARGYSTSASVGLFVLVSGSAHAIKPAALTYNSLNLIAVCVALGLLGWAAARLQQDRADRLAVPLLVGAALVAAVDLLIKPTTAAFLLAVVVGYGFLSPALPAPTRRRLIWLSLAAGGATALVMLVIVGGFGPLWVRARDVWGILQNDAFMQELNTRTLREFRELGTLLWQDLRWVAAVVLGATVGAWLLRGDARRQRAFAGGAALVILGVWGYRAGEAGLWRGSHTLYELGIVARFYLGLALPISVLALLSVWLRPTGVRRWSIAAQKTLAWGLLLVTPFAGAYGSTTSMYLNGAIYAVCWLGIILLATMELVRRWQAPWLGGVVQVLVAGFAVAHVYHGQIQMPYMNPRPLWEQTVRTELGTRGAHLLLDQPTSDVINETRRILTAHGFQPGDDIFCFFNIPGLVYAVGGRSPVIPWYFGRIYVGNPIEEWYMQRAGEERRRNAWVMTQAEVTQFREHFVRGGINFPDGYEEIGALRNPQSGLEVKLWKPVAPTGG